jgi:tetratricopeptide (TPR) repeat protein
MPVDHALAENADGSKTIWFGETERRHRMKWLIGVTLRPGSSCVEATVKIFNRTPHPHSILYWANVAVHVDENYQVIFPPSVTAATYHSKNDFVHWPIGAESYRGTDYRDVNLSWWKNHPEPISFFAWNMQEDFMGGYDHGKKAGVIHVGNHHVVCGAKLWEWSPGPRGRMWDKILTDTDGPYAELMVGAFSDNQPDYSWIKPYEVKTFQQCWYPVREIGGCKKANLNAAVNLELTSDRQAKFGFNTTSAHSNARVSLTAAGRTIKEQTVAIGPDKPFVASVAVPEGAKAEDLRLSLTTAAGQELIAYRPVAREYDPNLPPVVRNPSAPKDIETIEELYLTGLRVEQIHNPRVDPSDYYEEALRRDPNDTRTNTIVGVRYIKRGLYTKAEEHLRRAVSRLSAEYTRPGNAEALYHLGVALRAQGKTDEAYDLFYRSTWDYAHHAAAYYQLAELSCGRGRFDTALAQVAKALLTNARNTKALNLKAAILRHRGDVKQAQATAEGVLLTDPLDFLAMNELYLAQQELNAKRRAAQTLERLEATMRRDVQAYLELAADYMGWGLTTEAIEVLGRAARDKTDSAGLHPLVYYYLGHIHRWKGHEAAAREFLSIAPTMPAAYCFPFRAESIAALTTAIDANRDDARAHYYLGNALYEIQPDSAIDHWEQAAQIDPSFAPLHRNLGWGYYRTQNDIAKAIASYEKAVEYDSKNARAFAELDRLYELGNVAPNKRLEMLEKNHDTVVRRNDSYVRELMVLVLTGHYDKAIEYMTTHHFHVREGGGEIRDVYVDAYLLRGIARLTQKQPEAALEDFLAAAEYPENLSVGRPQNDSRAAQIAYYTARAHQAMDEADKAKAYYEKSAAQKGTHAWPEARFYQALSMVELGQAEPANQVFNELIQTGTNRIERDEGADFFAKFGEQQAKAARLASAHYIRGLGYSGSGRPDAAYAEFQRATTLNTSHVWARAQRAIMNEQPVLPRP